MCGGGGSVFDGGSQEVANLDLVTRLRPGAKDLDRQRTAQHQPSINIHRYKVHPSRKSLRNTRSQTSSSDMYLFPWDSIHSRGHVRIPPYLGPSLGNLLASSTGLWESAIAFESRIAIHGEPERYERSIYEIWPLGVNFFVSSMLFQESDIPAYMYPPPYPYTLFPMNCIKRVPKYPSKLIPCSPPSPSPHLH